MSEPRNGYVYCCKLRGLQVLDIICKIMEKSVLVEVKTLLKS